MLATAQKNMEKKKAGLVPDAGGADGLSAVDRADERVAMETAPEIDSENASIGCVPDTEASRTQPQPSASRRKVSSAARPKGHGLMGLFRRK